MPSRGDRSRWSICPSRTLPNGFAGFQGGAGRAIGAEVPAPAAVEWKRVLPAGDKITAVFLQLVQGALQAVEHAAEQSRAEAYCQGPLRGRDRLANAEATIVLEDLDRGDPALETDHFTGQATAADKHPVTDFQVGAGRRTPWRR